MALGKSKKNKRSLAIAFSMIVGYFLLQGIFLYVLSSNRSRPLSRSDLSFSLSKDGTKIVYSDAGNGGSDLFIADLQTGRETRLTDSPYYELYPSLSADNRKLVFTRGTPAKLADELCMMDLETNQVTQITNANENITTPVFTPDGKSVMYCFESKSRGGLASTWMDSGALAKLDLSTNKRTVYFPESSRTRNPSFSTDGKMLAWSSNGQIHLAPSNDPKDFKLVLTGGFSPALSPDGKKIAYVTGMYARDFHVEIVTADGKSRTTVPNTNEVDQAAFLPDGSLVILMQFGTDSPAKNRLFKIQPDGSGKAKLLY